MNRSATILGLCCMLVLTLGGCEDEEPQSTVFSGTLIFVEDESPLRRSLARFLELRGYQVVQAASVAEAEGSLDIERFEAALVDVCLPDGNGLGLLERIGRDRSIAMTAYLDPATFEECGVVHHMEKPLDLNQTAALVAAVVAA